MTLASESTAHFRRPMKFERNVPQQGDALYLLVSQSDGCAALVITDYQHRHVMDYLALGNEGARQKGRFALPQMSSEYIDACEREISRLLKPSAYYARWMDTTAIGEAHHLRVPNGLKTVDLIAWDSLKFGMGKRSRRRGDYLLIQQKPPIIASNWTDHSIPSRWVKKVDRKLHKHPRAKPPELTRRLIGAVTEVDDLVIDPAAGGFVVMRAALSMKREFIGVDIAFNG